MYIIIFTVSFITVPTILWLFCGQCTTSNMGYLNKAIELSNLSQEKYYSFYNGNFHFQLFSCIFVYKTQLFLFAHTTFLYQIKDKTARAF